MFVVKGIFCPLVTYVLAFVLAAMCGCCLFYNYAIQSLMIHCTYVSLSRFLLFKLSHYVFNLLFNIPKHFLEIFKYEFCIFFLKRRLLLCLNFVMAGGNSVKYIAFQFPFSVSNVGIVQFVQWMYIIQYMGCTCMACVIECLATKNLSILVCFQSTCIARFFMFYLTFNSVFL